SADELRERRARRRGVEVTPRPATRARKKPAAEPTPAVEDNTLSERLANADIDDTLLERLERWLREGGDDDLEKALAAIAPNPMQKAFELTMTARANRTYPPS